MLTEFRFRAKENRGHGNKAISPRRHEPTSRDPLGPRRRLVELHGGELWLESTSGARARRGLAPFGILVTRHDVEMTDPGIVALPLASVLLLR